MTSISHALKPSFTIPRHATFQCQRGEPERDLRRVAAFFRPCGRTHDKQNESHTCHRGCAIGLFTPRFLDAKYEYQNPAGSPYRLGSKNARHYWVRASSMTRGDKVDIADHVSLSAGLSASYRVPDGEGGLQAESVNLNERFLVLDFLHQSSLSREAPVWLLLSPQRDFH